MAERLTIRGEGIDLAADAMGPADGPRVLFLHGGGQTRQSWGNAVEQAARRGYRAVTIDARGHGESDWSPDGTYSLDLYTADLRHVMAAVGGEPVLVGASLGGLTALLVSASPAPRARGLVLVDVTPRIEPEGAKEIGDFMASAPHGFATVEEAADAVAAYLPHRPRPRDTSGLKRNLRLRDGRYYWHWDPAMLNMQRERDFDTDEAIPASFAAAARKLTIPTLLVRGGRSRVVSDRGVEDLLRLTPHAEVADIAGAHHMVAGDANDAFNQAIFAFLDRHFS